MRTALRIAIVLALISRPALAQTDDFPKKGTWGVETCIGCFGGSLMHFRNPTTVWLTSVNAAFNDSKSEQTSTPGGTSTSDQSFVTVSVGLGLRSYRLTETKARPFLGVGGNVGYITGNAARGPSYGGYAEMGTSYFFTPHLSLGAAGVLSASFRRVEDGSPGFSSRQTSTSVSFGPIRLLAALYF